jgi:hypothetical protein
VHDAVLAKFLDAKRGGGAGWSAKCPAHDDRRASLSIGTGDDGRVLLHCHAGCSLDAILAAANLETRDLFPDKTTATTSTIVATYPYHDESGVHLYDVVRFEPKDFRQRRADGTWKMSGVRRVLYRLRELQGQAVAYIPEGEKDADRLRAIGLPATTTPGGAGKWQPAYLDQLKAAGVGRVVVLPDHDEPGLKHANDVAASCHKADLEVKVVTLPGVPPKGDISDWLAAGHTRADLIALVKAAPLYEPSTAAPAPTASGLKLTTLSDLLAEPDEAAAWLVEGRIATGSINLLAGKPKCGKSTAVRGLALEIARGGHWLGFRCQRGTVWYLVLEDKRSEVKRHFRRMGGREEPVRFLFDQPGDKLLAKLHALALAERPALIIIDTLQRLIKAKDLNDYSEVTTKLTPILTLARETGAAVLLVHHAGKTRTGMDGVLGSTALTGSVDNVFIIERDARYRLLSSVQRIGDDLLPTTLTLDPQTGYVQFGVMQHEADRAVVEASILEAAATEPQTEAKLDKEVTGSTRLKRKALRELVKTGRVLRFGKGGKKDPYTYAKPVPENAENALAVVPVPEAGNTHSATEQPDTDSGSCFLVPSYSREQRNNNPEKPESPNVDGPDSCSRVPASGPFDPDSREQAFDEPEVLDL